MSPPVRTAYVPDLDRDREDAARLAVDWVSREVAARGTGAVLLTGGAPAAGIPSLQRLLDAGALTTKSAKQLRPAPRQRPTLAHEPDEAVLEKAAGFAGGAALCAVEGPSFRLAGWAAATGAIDLDTGVSTAPPRAEVVTLLDRLVLHASNGFGDIPGKRAAPEVLGLLRDVAPGIDGDYIAGWLIGKSRSARAGRTIRELIGG